MILKIETVENNEFTVIQITQVLTIDLCCKGIGVDNLLVDNLQYSVNCKQEDT